MRGSSPRGPPTCPAARPPPASDRGRWTPTRLPVEDHPVDARRRSYRYRTAHGDAVLLDDLEPPGPAAEKAIPGGEPVGERAHHPVGAEAGDPDGPPRDVLAVQDVPLMVAGDHRHPHEAGASPGERNERREPEHPTGGDRDEGEERPQPDDHAVGHDEPAAPRELFA